MKAVIMAGGEGSRIRPITSDLPKPMVPIMNKPIMEHIVKLLKSHGITQIGVTLMYLPQKIQDYFGNGQNLGVNLHYFTENSPLGTAGSVKNAEKFLDETFIVISGDSLTNMNLSKALEYHRQKKSKATIVLTKVDVPLDYGVVITDPNGAVTDFYEKPSWGEVFSDTVNTGTYILEPEVLQYIKSGQKFDFSQDLFPLMLKNNEPLFGYVTNDYWCDIGDLKSYIQAHHDILKEKISLQIDESQIRKNVFVGSNTFIDPEAAINGPCLIGSNCKIGKGTIIGEYTVIGNNNILDSDVKVERSVILDNNYIESGSRILGSIICNKTNIKRYVTIMENAVVGDKCLINERAIIKPNVKIWPHKTVESFATVDRNVIWGVRHIKTIFGENGLSGIINVDITPEFATRLGAAYGSVLKENSKAVVSSTTSNAARMFKHAFVSGILSVGVEVYNLSSLLTPIARHAVRFLAVEGGIHIKTNNNNPNILHIDFMDAKGASISKAMERKIENVFAREDFKRCSGSEISRLNNITDFKNYYMRSVLNEVEVKEVRNKSPKICIVSPSDFVISLVVPMLTDVGCKVVSFFSSDLENISAIVQEINKNNAEFAAFIDSNGETLILIDKDGNVIKEDLFLTLTSLIIFKVFENPKVIVPITAPSVIEEIANKYKGSVHRTKTSQQAVMEQMLDHNMIKNKESMCQFLLNFDAVAGLVKIIEYLCRLDISLSDLLKEIPDFYTSKKHIFCPWELKGKVMRKLITDKNGEKVELVDGVKFILDNGWALVLPDADMPLCRIYSEGISPQVAEEISNKYLSRISSIINTN